MNRMTIGGTPSDELCAQLGVTTNAQDLNRLECRAYIAALVKHLGEPPEGVILRLAGNPHDFGTYYEVEVGFEDGNEAATAYAYKAEKGLSRWSDVNFWEPVKYADSQPIHIMREPALWDRDNNRLARTTLADMAADQIAAKAIPTDEPASPPANPDNVTTPPTPEPLHGIADWGSETTPLQQAGKEPITRNEARRFDYLWQYANGHLGFYGYLRVADAAISKRTSLGLLDLPDYAWRDAYDEQRSPEDVVDELLEEEGMAELD